jgi:hypothetical protein
MAKSASVLYPGVFVSLNTVRLLIYHYVRRSTPLVSTALFLLLAFQTKSFATSFSTESLAIFTNTTSNHNGTVTTSTIETTAEKSAPYTVAANKSTPDWSGIRRDTGILFGAQIVAAGFLFIMPESVSGWNADQKKNSFDKYSQNFVSPAIDKDKAYINYVLHPYWGATYYTRARERGLDKGASFAYSTVISTMFEFGVECFFERPSIQDLIVTPVAGSLIGAFIFEPWRDSIKSKGALRWYDHAVLVATDPIGVISLEFEKLFGIKPTIMINNSVPKLQKRSAGSAVSSTSNRIEVVLQFPFN